tara:strand:+ start:824 stop:1039 length:216 start_codon:yes stop_codon:yes gene_type:complete
MPPAADVASTATIASSVEDPSGLFSGIETPVEVSFCVKAYRSTSEGVGEGADPYSELIISGVLKCGAFIDA